MWTRKQLKKEGKGVFRKHYWRVIAICFVVAFLTGAYGETMSIIRLYDTSREVQNVVQDTVHPQSNSDIVNDTLHAGQAVVMTSEDGVENSQGVLAMIFNNVTKSGNFFFGVLNAINQAVFHDRIMAGIILLIGAFLMAAYWFLIQNPLLVSECRFFMEAGVYEDTPIRRLWYLVRIRRVWQVAKVMFFRSMYLFFWAFTIVGWFIKSYSYMMVPYIIAENPDADRKEVFALSKRMMQGNKWSAFVLQLSFVPWLIVSALSMNLLRIFYVNPYLSATKAQLYLTLRKIAIEEKFDHYQILNDEFLACPPIEEETKEPMRAYPMHLYTIPEHEKRHFVHIEYRRDYSLSSIILLFFTFSIVGWVWEVVLFFVLGNGLINRGVSHGPWLPIYGSGGVLVILLLKKVREKPVLTFFLSMAVCGTIEYFTSLFLEMTKGVKWWDYTGYFLNLNGRICAEGLLIFGFGCCAAIYVGAPLLDDFYKKIPLQPKKTLCTLLVVLFAIDQLYSLKYPNTGKGITDGFGPPPIVEQSEQAQPAPSVNGWEAQSKEQTIARFLWEILQP